MRCRQWYPALPKPPESHVHSHTGSAHLYPHMQLVKEKSMAHFLAGDLPQLQTQDTEINSEVPLKASPFISGENSKKEDADFINPMD